MVRWGGNAAVGAEIDAAVVDDDDSMRLLKIAQMLRSTLNPEKHFVVKYLEQSYCYGCNYQQAVQYLL